MKTILRKMEYETWLQAIQRVGRAEGLEEEVTEFFYKLVNDGHSEEGAAFGAGEEWGILDLVDEDNSCLPGQRCLRPAVRPDFT